MSREFHYLVAGLPDILFEDSKLSMGAKAFAELLAESLSDSEMALINRFFYRYDNQNILARLEDSNSVVHPDAVLQEKELQEIFEAAKEASSDTLGKLTPSYLVEFIQAYKSDSSLFEGKAWDLQLSQLYYQFATSGNNSFVSKWFAFERDLQNLLTAVQCRKYELHIEKQLIGGGDLVEKLARSNARDFGIDSDFPMLDQILKIVEEEDLKEFEKKVDRIKWDFLDEEVFFHFFTIEKLFSFLVKLSIVERWIKLDKETGQKLFNELLNSMEASYEFPEEFKSKK